MRTIEMVDLLARLSLAGHEVKIRRSFITVTPRGESAAYVSADVFDAMPLEHVEGLLMALGVRVPGCALEEVR